MSLHFSREEFADRLARLQAAMDERKLDVMMLFSQDSMYWLTGYDSFGYCFFQCLVVTRAGKMVLLTRAPDLRQARHTSLIESIEVWTDRQGADPTADLHALMSDMDLVGRRLGIEYGANGLDGRNTLRLVDRFENFGKLSDATDIIPALRAVKSPAEIECVRRAAVLADDALDAARPLIKPGGDEGEILAAMHSAIFAAGGDYPGNGFIIGSGADALLCRTKSGRRKLDADDQLTLEWAGIWRHYHAALMRTVVIGRASPRQLELYDACRSALAACRAATVVGQPVSAIFDAHARVLDEAGMARHRLNACGYSLGASFGPSWMDPPMLMEKADRLIEPNMVLFEHMIIADSDSGFAMTLGETFLTTPDGPERLSRHDVDLMLT